MAAASTQKLQDIVECPICLETLTEPRMFGCFHFYCQKCVHDMKEAQQDETVGYECPLCRNFTAKGQLQSLPIMGQLLDAINSARGEGEKCGKCKDISPVWRCVDCKKNFCVECKHHHDSFEILQSHKWKKCNDTLKAVIDIIEFCDVHPSKQVEFYCRDCKQLICLLCRGTSHHQHAAETTEEALQQILPMVKENLVKVKAMIATTKAEISLTKERERESTKQHNVMDHEIKSHYDVMMAKLKEDYANLSKEVQASREEMDAKHKSRAKQLELQLQSQENVLSISQSTLDTTQNISLLKALQSGVMDSLSGSLEGVNTVQEVEKWVTVFKATPKTDDNLLGCVEKLFKVSCQLETSCDDLMKKAITLQKDNKLSFQCRRFDIINHELWCVEYKSNNIHVYTLDSQKKQTIAHYACSEVRSVVEFDENKCLMSASNGLFTVSTDKRHEVKKECDGNFCDATVHKTQVYALTADNSAKVYVLRFDSSTSSFSKQKEFGLKHFQTHPWNTIQATSNNVFVGLAYCRHVIQQYTLDGQLVREHGRQGRNVGELLNPLLSGSDLFNNILIAGNDNRRLDVLQANCSFCTLPVTGLDGDIMCARIHNAKLYVALWKSKCIKVFSIT